MLRSAMIFPVTGNNFLKALLPRLCGGLFACFLIYASSAQAATIALPTEGRPLATSSFNLALLFYGLTGQLPDFSKWAEATEEYKKASPYDLEQVRTEQANKMKSAYSLLSFEEPIIINTKVKLSLYSKVLQGFKIESFKVDTFFAYSFQDVDYAVVPNALMDFIYVDVSDPSQVERIQAEMNRNHGYIPLTMYVTPRYADKKSQMQLGDRKYWLISGDITAMALYTRGGKKAQILWEKGATPQGEKTKTELLNLYK